MTRRSIAALILAGAGFSFAQTGNHAAAEKQILANEMAVNAGFEKHDAAAITKNLLSDAVAVDPGGAASISDFLKMLPDFKVQPGWKIDMSKFQWLGENTVIHMYRWTGKGTMMGQPLPSPTWSSTVWVLRDGQWKAAFHQETAAMAPPPPAPAKK